MAYLDFKDKQGLTLLDHAKENQNEGILCLLVDAGANLGQDHYTGKELLFLSILKEWNNLFKILIKKGVPISSQDPQVLLY